VCPDSLSGRKLRKELPRVAGSENVAARIPLARVVVAVVDDPGGRVAGAAVLVRHLGRVVAVGLGLRHGLAPVEADVLVADLAAHADVEDAVGRAVLSVVGHGRVAAAAAAQDGTGNDGDGADHGRAGAGDGVRHGAAVAEAGREAQRRLDAQGVLDGRDHLVEEGDVLAVLVAPARVEALRDHEDGVVVGVEGGEAVVGEGTAAVGVLALDDLLGAAAELVPGEDEAVGLVAVVVVGQLDHVLALLVVDVERVGAAGLVAWALAAAGRPGRRGDGGEDPQEEEDGQGEDVAAGGGGHLGRFFGLVRDPEEAIKTGEQYS